nr:unnamed protein product [Callosobruchus analis]
MKTSKLYRGKIQGIDLLGATNHRSYGNGTYIHRNIENVALLRPRNNQLSLVIFVCEHIRLSCIRAPNLVQIGRLVRELVHVNKPLFKLHFEARAATLVLCGAEGVLCGLGPSPIV